MPQGSRIPREGGRLPSLRGLIVVDEIHGKIRLRSWPKPRGKNRNPTNIKWSNWLKAATYIYRYSPAYIQWTLQDATKGTVWMPRDVLISAIRGRAFLLQDEHGRTYYPMAVRQDVSNSLDAIGQQPGDMLWRGQDGWERVPKGSPGLVLTYQDDSTPPTWAPGGGSSYVVVPLLGPLSGKTQINVNNTSYIVPARVQTYIDWDAINPSQFRILIWGGSGAAGQSIFCQLNTGLTPGNPTGAGGDEITIPNTDAWYNSGWIDVVNPGSGWDAIAVALRGSNATVDLETAGVIVHFR